MFADVISGKILDRLGLPDLLDHIRPCDTLAVVRLDSLERSLQELHEVVGTLKKRGIALLSLEEKIDTSSAAGELVFHVFGAIARSNAASSLSAPAAASTLRAPKAANPAGRHSIGKR